VDVCVPSLLHLGKLHIKYFLSALQIFNLLILLSQSHKEFIGVDVIKKFNFFDLILKLIKPLRLAGFVLVQPTTVCFHITNLFLKLINNFLSCS
jgi:hypothetical protein